MAAPRTAPLTGSELVGLFGRASTLLATGKWNSEMDDVAVELAALHHSIAPEVFEELELVATMPKGSARAQEAILSTARYLYMELMMGRGSDAHETHEAEQKAWAAARLTVMRIQARLRD